MYDTKALAARYRKLYTGVVFDAMRRDANIKQQVGLSPKIRPLWPRQQPFAGPAFICVGQYMPGDDFDDTIRLEMFDVLRDGDVFVFACGGAGELSVFGDVLARMLQQRGVAGAVLDGYTRDTREIAEIRFPVFCRGPSPADAYGRWGIRNFSKSGDHIPAVMAGAGETLTVWSGDWIFADLDGVLVIPRDKAAEVCQQAERRADRERKIRDAIASESAADIHEKYGRW